LVEYFIFNKNKVIELKAGEKINLLTKLEIAREIEDLEKKYMKVF